MTSLPSALAALLADQADLATRDQLRAFGITRGEERAQLEANRWRAINRSVICMHNGPLTPLQKQWAALLSTPAPVALCGLTGLERHGVTGFATPAVHLLVERGARVSPCPGIEMVVHESRRFTASDVLPRLPAVTGLERAAIDAAVWSADVRTATRIVVATIQQRRTSVARLRVELARAGSVRHRRVLGPFLADLEGGAEALSEVEFLRWCRRHQLPKPVLQVTVDRQGRRRYLDATFVSADGRVIGVEIDGGVHLSLAARWSDTAKDNDAAIAGELTLRFPSVAIYSNDPRAVAQVRAALGLVSRSGGHGRLTG